MWRQLVVLARRSRHGLLPGAFDLALPLQAAQQGVDGTLLGRKRLPLLKGGHEVVAVARFRVDQGQDAQLEGATPDLRGPLTSPHHGPLQTDAILLMTTR